jgi:hypothetical protein
MKNTGDTKPKHDFNGQKNKTNIYSKNKLLVNRQAKGIGLLPLSSAKMPLVILNYC